MTKEKHFYLWKKKVSSKDHDIYLRVSPSKDGVTFQLLEKIDRTECGEYPAATIDTDFGPDFGEKVLIRGALPITRDIDQARKIWRDRIHGDGVTEARWYEISEHEALEGVRW